MTSGRSNNGVFLKNGFIGFIAGKVPHSRTVKEALDQLFFKNMKLSSYGSGDRLKSTQKDGLNRQRRCIGRIRYVFVLQLSHYNQQHLMSL